jgi:hypothetical protein
MSQDLGLDRSGNGNNWTLNNLTIADQMIDRPTNNFATQNPLCNAISNAPDSGDASPTFSKGNLRIVTALTPAGRNASTIGVLSGKYYAEMYHEAGVSGEWVSPRNIIGITTNLVDSIQSKNGSNLGNLTTSEDVGYTGQTGNKNVGNSWTSYGASWTIGDIIGVALNMDDEEVTFYKNNASQGTISFTAGGEGHFMSGDTSAGGGLTAVWNYGQDSSFAGNKTAQGNRDGNGIGDFYYEPPTDFLALCTQNLPEPAVTPSEHFNTVLWTGNGTTGTNITNVGFAPSLTWLKGRDIGSDPHQLYDTVRGATKSLKSNATDAEITRSTGLTAFGTDGFTIGNHAYVNRNTSIYVAWNWKANGSGSANTVGDIDSTVSVNTDAGFSIISYTANGSSTATVGHGLSQTAEMVFTKRRDSSRNWHVGHKDLPFNSSSNSHHGYLSLNGTGASDPNNGGRANIPNATTFQGEGSNNATMIAYCFHSVDGYSKVGSYIGNQNADGTFVYTGFRPAFVLIKNTVTAGEGFVIMNNKSDPSNVVGTYITVYPGTLSEQGTAGTTSSRSIDFVSNGFKLRGNSTEINEKGDMHIYLAFAETSFKYSNAR